MEYPAEREQPRSYLERARERARCPGNNTSADGRQGPRRGRGLENRFYSTFKEPICAESRTSEVTSPSGAAASANPNAALERRLIPPPFYSLTRDTEYGSGVNRP